MKSVPIIPILYSKFDYNSQISATFQEKWKSNKINFIFLGKYIQRDTECLTSRSDKIFNNRNFLDKGLNNSSVKFYVFFSCLNTSTGTFVVRTEK